MAFPTVQNTTKFDFNTDATSHSCTIPGGWTINNKDVLIFIAAFDGNTAQDDETGYTKIRSDVNGVAKAAHLRRCDGSEAGTSVSFSHSGTSEQGQVLLWHIRGTYDDSTVTNIVEAGSWSQAANVASNPNPNSNVTPTWGSAETLWIAAIVAYTDAGQNITAAPSGYGSLFGGGTTGGAASSEVWGSHQALIASSQNPGAWTGSGVATDDWYEIVLAVRPLVDAQLFGRPYGAPGAKQQLQLLSR